MMRFGCVVMLLFCGWVRSACCQDLEKVDSLKVALEGKHGRLRSEVLWELASEYLELNDNVTALTCIDEAYILAQQAPVDSLWLVHMWRVKVRVLGRLEQYDKAFAVLDDILPIARRNLFDAEASLCLGAAGRMYALIGKYDKALLTNLESLGIREKLGNVENVSIVENNIGFLYYKIENYGKALEYFFRSLASKHAAGSHYDEDLLYINIGFCYRSLGKTELALKYVNQALQVCGERCSDNIVMDGTLALGVIYLDLKKPTLARQNLLRCHQLALRTGNQRYQSESLVCLGREANDSQLYNRALKYLKESERTALMVNSRSILSETYYELFRASKGVKDYSTAMLHWNSHWLYHDSLLNESLGYALISAQVEFEQNQNKTQLALQESTVQWQGYRNFWIAVVGGLLLIVVELLLYDYWSRRGENDILESEVRKRTQVLNDKVKTLEREAVERSIWKEKVERSIARGHERLEALADMTGHQALRENTFNMKR